MNPCNALTASGPSRASFVTYPAPCCALAVYSVELTSAGRGAA
jgi:hypothetical protein